MNIRDEIERLNPRQKEAVLHTEGPLLVLAGAGSGKTKTITMRAAYLLDRGAAARNVLSVTFTNKAAMEMRERIVKLLGDRGQPPLISTFHSLCLNILRSEIGRLGYRKNFTVFDTSEQMSLLRNLMSDLDPSDRSFKADDLLVQISMVKNGMTDWERMSKEDEEKGEVSRGLYDKYQESLRTFNVVDFDDLLLLTLRLFREHPEAAEKYRDRFRYVMVDEYQDTNRVQYEIVRMIAGERKNVCVVGDDDQSIYGWRGADLGNILDFEKDFPGTKVVKLEQNYRSTGHILSAANSVIRNNRLRKEKSLWTDRHEGNKVAVLKTENDEDEARWVAEKIALMKYSNPKLSYDDFAVIYRSNNLSRSFEEALRGERIPYTVVGGTSYFDRKEIKDIAAYLKVIVNQRDDLSLLRIANVPKRGLGTTTIGRLASFARENSIPLIDAFRRASEAVDSNDRSAAAAASLASLIDRYAKMFAGGGPVKPHVEELVHEIEYRDYLYDFYKTPDVAVRRVGSVDDFIRSVSGYDSAEDSPSLNGFLGSLALTDMDDKKEKESFGVTLISVHSAKGLEFPVVFLVGIEEDILPHRKSAFDSSGIEEERRLFYVGITRAMRNLYITHTASRRKFNKEAPSTASRFLSELAQEAVEQIDRMKEESPEEQELKAKAFFANINSLLAGG